MTGSEGTRPGWLLDEMASIGRENLDTAHISLYDDKEDAAPLAEVELVRGWGLVEGATVVDLGAGTGQFALAAAEAGARVIAVDPSPPMLDRLAEKARARGVAIEAVRAGFLTYEHAGAPADIVYTRYALHHLPDFWKAIALTRMRQMLRTGGVLRLWDVVFHFPAEEAAARIEEWCASLPLEAEGGWVRSDLEEHIRDEHSTFTWLIEPMFTRAGFAINEADYSEDGFFAKYLLTAV